MDNIAIWNDLFLVKNTDDRRDSEIFALFSQPRSGTKLKYMSKAETERFSQTVRDTIRSDDAVLLIGTRPVQIFAPDLSPFQYLAIYTKRYKSENGREKKVEISQEDTARINSWLDRVSASSRRIVLLEDAIVEGGTLDAVLSVVDQKWNRKVQIFVLFSCEKAKEALTHAHPLCSITALHLLPGKPITDCTVLFLSDLIGCGEDGDNRFLDNEKLLRPCFHDDYERIRDGLTDIMARYQSKFILADAENEKAGYFYLTKVLLDILKTAPDTDEIRVRLGKNRWYSTPHLDLFDAIFQQPKMPSRSPDIILTSKNIEADLKYGDYDQDSPANQLYSAVWNRFFLLKEPIRDRLVSDILHLTGGTLPMAGCHIRTGFSHGFYGHPNAVPMNDYFKEIQTALESGYTRVFIASDSADAVSRAVDRFGDKVLFFPCLRSPGNAQPIEYYLEADSDHGLENLYETYRDMFALSVCDYLICGRSNLSYMALISKLARHARFSRIRLLDQGICKGGVFWGEYVDNGWNTDTHEWLFVSDLDGTLLSDGKLDPVTERGLQDVASSFIPFTIATARSVSGMKRALGEYLPYLPTIHYSGAMIWDHHYHSIIKAFPFSSEEFAALIARIIDRGNDFMIIACREKTDRAYILSEQQLSHFQVRFSGRSDMLPAITDLEWLQTHTEPIAVYEYCASSHPAEGEWKSFSTESGWQYISNRAGKKAAVQVLKDFYQYRKVAAFGDNENDKDLLLASDCSYIRKEDAEQTHNTFQDCASVPMIVKKIWKETK